MKNKVIPIIEMLIIAAAGIVLVVNPGDSLFAAARILGIALLAYGIFNVIKYLAAKEDKSVLDIVIGVIAAIFGIVVLSKPDFVINVFPILSGVVVAVAGLKSLIENAKAKNTLGIVFAVITIALGILLFANPFGTAALFARILGVILIYIGVTGIIGVAKA